MKTLKKDAILYLIMAIPFAYLFLIWKKLPLKIPVHWNYKGEIDRFGSKEELIILIFILPILTYLVFTIAPKIDSKKKIKTNDRKYIDLKNLVVSLMSMLSCGIIFMANNESQSGFILVIIGLFFIVIGNYLKTIKPNYFIGIKTPWTIHNEWIWKKTHNLGGMLWFVGGITIILANFIVSTQLAFMITLVAVSIMVIAPVVYSYLIFKTIEDK